MWLRRIVAEWQKQSLALQVAHFSRNYGEVPGKGASFQRYGYREQAAGSYRDRRRTKESE